MVLCEPRRIFLFQSTPSVKRVTLILRVRSTLKIISIHTLCEEGDGKRFLRRYKLMLISIHTLCEEGDSNKHTGKTDNNRFQSTPSVKRVTLSTRTLKFSNLISIHTLCEEGDRILAKYRVFLPRFQSTPSVKRVTLMLSGSQC